MRSQAAKPLPKKGDLSKTLKSSTAKQAAKKAVSPKKIKNLVNKSLIKNPKKSSSKDNSADPKNDEASTDTDKSDPLSETNKPGPSKGTLRGESPTKKPKKDPKEKKDTVKSTSDIIKKTAVKKNTKTDKKSKPIKSNVKKNGKGNNKDIKYKINKEIIAKTTPKFSKAKTVNIKKGNITSIDKKKSATQQKEDTAKDQKLDECKNNKDDVSEENKSIAENKDDSKTSKQDEDKDKDNIEPNSASESATCKILPKLSSPNQSETPKAETERPPKFFTSSRSPRTVDIDVKCCKNSKGNLSVSERFLSMKVENKSDDSSKDSSNTLISQGPEIDVYTFTEKVDSPKSILSDFRSPINKNVGRVRPIARVKGTVIDKKTDVEKKKYSPHRPIEEVVKQLKSKRSEELNANQNQNAYTASNIEKNIINTEIDAEEKPKPIVSKSYKMVARKSSITGKPFSPIRFPEREPSPCTKPSEKPKSNPNVKKSPAKSKKQTKKCSLSDDDIDNSKFALNTKNFHYTSSDESVSESNDDNDTKESSESDNPKTKKTKNKKFKKNRITDSAKKPPSKELKELSKDSLIDLKESSALLGNEKPSKRRLKLLSLWSGPKKHRMASLNAIAKVHCLYENESRTHMELGLMKTIDRQIIPGTSKTQPPKKKETKPKEIEKQESTSESEYEVKKERKEYTSESSDDNPPQRSLRGEPGIRSAGKYWDPKSSTSSSEDSELETKKKVTNTEKKKAMPKVSSNKSDSDKPPAKMKKTTGTSVKKKKRNRNEVVMDLKDMVVQKRMASLNATAILAASYEKRSPKSTKDETTSDSCSDESFSHKSKNGVSSGVKSELKPEFEPKIESDESAMSDRKQKVEVIVNQESDVTITGVYSTHHHEGFCTVSGMQYRISSTSHTQTTATANCEKEGCSREDGARYTPLSALSSMQPPAEHVHSHPHPVGAEGSHNSSPPRSLGCTPELTIPPRLIPVPELGGLARRPGCSSAFSAPSTASHHEPGEWFHGPKFLYEKECLWPEDIIHTDTSEPVVTVTLVQSVPPASIPVPDPQRFSSWLRLVRTMAMVLKFIDKCNGVQGEIDCNTMERAERLLLKYVQAESYAAEIAAIKSNKSIQRNSKLLTLSPFLDEDGLLRVGGRIDAATNVSLETKRPIILDGKHSIAILIIRHYHVKAAHGNQETVVNNLKQKYWLVKLRPSVKSVVSRCMLCRLRKCNPKIPCMGNLPEARVAHHQRPFTFCGLDLFGPMEVTVGRRREKRYGVLFTCLTVRAIHVELVSSLTSDALIMALRRMAARRGWPRHLYSDNGTNLRGADKELQRSLQELDTEALKTEGVNNGMDWTFIPPASPHWGGAWERLIRSVKTSLKVILNERAPRDEVLSTLLAEIENMVNSRPSPSVVSVEPGSVESLTPNHFLLGSSSNLPVIGVFNDSEFYLRKQWRTAQRLADMFWQRWVKEVLPCLIPRKKWQEDQKPLQVGDLVLVVDPNSPRNTWPKGLVTRVFPGKDGRIRMVEVKTRSGTWRRSVARVAPILLDDECCNSTGVGSVNDAS